MPEYSVCPKCHAIGSVKSEQSMLNADPVLIYRCGDCGHEWLALQREQQSEGDT